MRIRYAGTLRVEDLVLTLRPKKYTLDLRDVEFIYPSAFVLLTALLIDEKDRIENLPRESGVLSYMSRMGFGKLTGIPLEPVSAHGPEGRFVELTRIASWNDMETFLLRLAEVFAPEIPSEELADILVSTSELVGNALQHSAERGPSAWCIAMAQKYRNHVEVAIADRGIGIRRSLQKGGFRIFHDAVAVDLAVKEGVTRDRQKFSGRGLFEVKRFAQRKHGFFWLWSGHGYFEAWPWREGAGPVPGYWKGTGVGFYFKRFGERT